MSDAVTIIPRWTRTTEGHVLHTESPSFIARIDPETERPEVLMWLEEPRFYPGEKEGLLDDLLQWHRAQDKAGWN